MGSRRELSRGVRLRPCTHGDHCLFVPISARTSALVSPSPSQMSAMDAPCALMARASRSWSSRSTGRSVASARSAVSESTPGTRRLVMRLMVGRAMTAIRDGLGALDDGTALRPAAGDPVRRTQAGRHRPRSIGSARGPRACRVRSRGCRGAQVPAPVCQGGRQRGQSRATPGRDADGWHCVVERVGQSSLAPCAAGARPRLPIRTAAAPSDDGRSKVSRAAVASRLSSNISRNRFSRNGSLSMWHRATR